MVHCWQVFSFAVHFGVALTHSVVQFWCTMSTRSRMTLPPVELSDLPERTKDFLIALCNQENITPAEGLKRVLDTAAQRAGFSPMPPASPDAQAQPQPEMAA